ncbi:GNAT family N-acetyltransferase [Pseudonocardia aurantiaca]|uniref:GNAT family N-acetyltransferase n=1 Tax=Pseudonocardia aurantiaca TaxID=75290 RepID=A0ABW4FGQ8_9PSEU
MAAPALPPTLLRRPMHPGDAARWADLLEAVEEADRRGEHYDAVDCAEELVDPELDLDRDTTFVLDAAGAPVAYQVLRMRSGTALGARVVTDAGVHPAHRRQGIGRALLAVAVQRAREKGASVEMRVAETSPGAVALAERAGMTPLRWWSELVRDLAEPVAPVAQPAGLTLVPLATGGQYQAARWDEPLRAAHNAAFADHWGSTPVSATRWEYQRTGGRAFRPSCSAVALAADGTIAGYVLAYEYAADTERTGRRDLYVGMVGTLAAYRGQGVAGALLAHVLQAAADSGYDDSSLTVDAQNATGALGVYERAGYRLHRREVTYSLPAATLATRAVP